MRCPIQLGRSAGFFYAGVWHNRLPSAEQVASDDAFAQYLVQCNADRSVPVKIARWELLAALLHARLVIKRPPGWAGNYQYDSTALRAQEQDGDFQAITAILVLRYMLQVNYSLHC